ncbi:hypothetical protein [Lysinibacillus sp. NPDC047702]|uniref:hypothetical protein n=1 Tax=unclassified Lysinibacillus TaxID=2636778 RepID=UPI003D041FA7
MLQSFIQRIIISIISAIIFSWVLSLYLGYTPIEEEVSETGGYSSKTLFWIFIGYSLVIYGILGVIISWIIDTKIQNQLNQAVLYCVSGAIIGGIVYLLTSAVTYMNRLLIFILIGFFAALLYFILLKILNLIVFKKTKSDLLKLAK